jgi:hypothetical protein
MHYISLAATIVTFAFASAVFYRFSHRKGMHLLMWGIGLVFYGLGTLGEVILSMEYSPFVLRMWYFSGAMMTAAWLGQGTIFLLIRKRGVAPALTWGLLAVSLGAAFLVFTAPVATGPGVYDVSQAASVQYRSIMDRSALMTLLTVLLNIYGTVALVGGALYSAFLFWRKRVLVQRMLGNILIALGALMPALAGTFLKLDMADWLSASQLIGAVIMFSGFLLATANKPAARRVGAASSPR